jgi:Fic family protein
MTAWEPRYTLTPAIARGLMAMEAARTVVMRTPLSASAEAELRRRARLRSTHYSTRIEGNRLTLDEAERVIAKRETFSGRERDVSEVRNYWSALLRVEEWAARRPPLTADLIRRLHGQVMRGPRAGRTPYRDGQNAVRDAATGAIVYLPPEAKDVPVLMGDMVAWAQSAAGADVPAPVLAGLVHYQFVTIHPYYDGNGRTARLLATFLLHRGGYGLNGFLSVEEHHAGDLAAYYEALAAHPHHNYYEGRATVDLTPWLEYFIGLLAGVFADAQREAERLSTARATAEPEALRRLDARARAVLGLFARREEITARDVAGTLALSERMARNLLGDWVAHGWIEVARASRKTRAYRLSATYRQYIGSATEQGTSRYGTA